jgi:toxin CcdB
MAQFDVYRNPDPRTRDYVPYLLDVQTGLLDHLKTRVVVPLILEDRMTAARRLNPIFNVENHRVVMATAELAAIRLVDIGPQVTSLDVSRGDIIGALDFLTTGI